MNWGFEDFGAAAAIALGAGIALATVYTSVPDRQHRAVLTCGVGVIVLFIWAHLAVGVF